MELQLNNWQKGKIIKYKLKIQDLIIEKIPYLIITDGKKTSKQFQDFLHYTCSCGQVELLGFIEKLDGKCKDCSGFLKK